MIPYRNFRGNAIPFILLAICVPANAQSIVRIEEDWALNVVEPDEKLDSPQIITAMLPFGQDSGTVLFLDINHGSSPSYSSGGFQSRIEQNGNTVADKRLLAGVKLNHAAETVKWTQVAYLQGNQIKFGIYAGLSQTWGYFGGDANLISSAVGEGSLDFYRYTDSLHNSGAVYAANRVASLTLLRVRVVNNLGQVIEISVNQSPL